MLYNKPTRIILIHGVRATKDNMEKMARLADVFKQAGFEVVVPKYGFVSALIVGLFKWIDVRIAETLSAFVGPEDILLGHSNGGTIAYLITQKLQVDGVVLINAALESDILPNAKFIHIYYNSGDNVVWLSKFVPFHPWGDIGKTGYTGPHDKRVLNVDQSNPPKEWLPKLKGHSDIFEVDHLTPWANYIATMVNAYVQVLKENDHGGTL